MRTLFFLLMIVIPLTSSAQDCDDFHVGTYRLLGEDGQFLPNYKLVFKKKHQIEYVGNQSTKSKQVWLDPCTYEVTIGKSDYLPVPEGTKMKCLISRTFANGFDVIVTSELADEAMMMTFIRVE